MKIKFVSTASEMEVTVEGNTLFACLAKIEEHFGIDESCALSSDLSVKNEFAELSEAMEEIGGIYSRDDFSDMDANFKMERIA